MRFLLLAVLVLPGCAVLHHVQVGDVDSRGGAGKKFDFKVSETGIDIEGAVRIGQSLTRNKAAQRQMQELNDIISMFQMGPRTGNLVFNDTYAEGVLLSLYESCPGGHITGLTSIRETRKYPVISGEIIKVTGYCKPRRKN